jgi:hypothetical protein
MTDSLEFDPGEIQSVQGQEYVRSDGLREAGKPDYEWLGSFLDNYGKIALPMKQALDRYYAERELAYNALADQHQFMGDALGDFLNLMQRTDDEGGRAISNVFNGPSGPGTVDGPSGPAQLVVGPNGSMPIDPAARGATPDAATPVGPGPVGSGAPDRMAPQPPAAEANTSNGTELAGAPAAPLAGQTPSAARDGEPRPQGHSQHAQTAPAQPPAGGPPSGGAAPGGGPGPTVMVPPTAPPGTTSPVAATAAGQVPGEPVAPIPVFPGAAPAGQRRAAGPSHDVDPGVNEDLVLARTLLAAILAAVSAGGARQSMRRVDWSVSVMLGPGGPSVFVTTSEGRGWLPSGLFLPQEVSVPWLSEVADAAPAEEEIADPARALVEFARTWGERSGARLTALVSSAGIDDELRALMGDSVGIEANIGPAGSDVDLAAPGAGLVDRFTATGGTAADVPESQVMAQCVRLAADANAQVVRSVGAWLERDVPEAAAARGLREQICAAVHAGRDVPEQLWQDLWNADAAVEAALAGHRSQVGAVNRRDVRLNSQSVVTRLLFERRCNELVLLLANGASQQTLRDVTYSHGHVVDHPALGRAPVAAAEVRGDRPVVAAPGGVLAPPVSPPAATPRTSSADDQAVRP